MGLSITLKSVLESFEANCKCVKIFSPGWPPPWLCYWNVATGMLDCAYSRSPVTRYLSKPASCCTTCSLNFTAQAFNSWCVQSETISSGLQTSGRLVLSTPISMSDTRVHKWGSCTRVLFGTQRGHFRIPGLAVSEQMSETLSEHYFNADRYLRFIPVLLPSFINALHDSI